MALILQTEKVGDITFARLKDGKPFYIEDTNNTEVAYDAEGAKGTITRLNGEAMGHRQRAEAAELKLTPFADIDPEAAKKALETVANLDQGALLTAGKVDEIKTAAVSAATKGFETRINAAALKEQQLVGDVTKLTAALHGEKITNAFSTSKYIADKLAVAPSMAQKVFGEFFKVEDDKLVAYGDNNVKLFSQERPGEIPTFDEALSIIVSSSPYKDSILKGKGHSGSGGKGADGKPLPNDGKTMTRAEFSALNPVAQMTKMREGVKVVD